jgi:hypothetical protein
MRRRLIDDTVVYTADLDEAEADWLSRRVRGDDGEQIARHSGCTWSAAAKVPRSSYLAMRSGTNANWALPFPVGGNRAARGAAAMRPRAGQLRQWQVSRSLASNGKVFYSRAS